MLKQIPKMHYDTCQNFKKTEKVFYKACAASFFKHD